MKIGIITLPLHNNYGGILQAYALQKVLQDMGHDVVVVDKARLLKRSFLVKNCMYLKRFIRKTLFDKNIVVKWDKEYNNVINTMRTNTYPFLLKYINRVEVIECFSEIKKGQFDAFVVGSDQIWRPMQLGNEYIHEAFLSFAKDWDVKRLSYAASFGTETWEYTPDQTVECADLLKRFDAVSVRESSATELCKKKFNVEALHVLDPTMLLDSDTYANLFKVAGTPKSPGTLMCYILDNNADKEKMISYVSQSLDLKPFSVNSKYEIQDAPLEERIQPPVESWLRGFNDAEFIITDSFHACVFSILFEKPFIVYGNKERGLARFASLLGMFGLENRLVTSCEEAGKVMNESIDWEKVNKIKKEWQEKSMKFLKDNL